MCPSTTAGASNSYTTASRSGMVPSSQSMRLWLALCLGMADHTPAQRPSLVLLCAQLPGASAGKPIPSSTAAGGRLVVFGLEVGGHWNAETASFLRLLARARASATPPALRPAAQAAWVLRWPRRCCCAKGACNHVPRAAAAC